MSLARDEFTCINLCHMTANCGAVNWNPLSRSCLLLSEVLACNSVTPTLGWVHHELINCSKYHNDLITKIVKITFMFAKQFNQAKFRFQCSLVFHLGHVDGGAVNVQEASDHPN